MTHSLEGMGVKPEKHQNYQTIISVTEKLRCVKIYKDVLILYIIHNFSIISVIYKSLCKLMYVFYKHLKINKSINTNSKSALI